MGGDRILKINSKIIFVLVFAYGICLSIVESKMQLSQNESNLFYFLGVVLLIILLSPYIVDLLRFQRKYASILPILQDEKDPARFIQELEKILEKINNTKIRNLYIMSLAAGYCENGDYNKAHQLLSSVNPKDLLAINQVIYYINMFAITLNLGDEEKALTILEEKKTLIKQYEKHPSIESAITVNMAYGYLAKKDIDKAKYYLDKAEKLCHIPYLIDIIEYLKADIMVNENCYDEARVVLERLKEKKLTPSLIRKITKLEASLEVK